MSGRPIALLVTLSPRVRASLKHTLCATGFDVVTTLDPEEAIDISFLWPPELVIVDRRLGAGGAGAHLVQRLRRMVAGVDAFFPAVELERIGCPPLVLLRAYEDAVADTVAQGG